MANAPFFRLPAELRLHIISYLVFPETTNLRATCTAFADLIPPQSSTYLDLLAAENGAWALKRRRLTCVYCARMRPATCFTEVQKRAKPCWRTCVDCYDYPEGWLSWWRRPPVNPHRTRYSKERRPQADGFEKNVCRACHNFFSRWGGLNECRQICRECYFEDDETELLYVEERRFFKDGERIERRFGGVLADWDEVAPIRDDKQWMWGWIYPGYCFCCLDDVPPKWREGHRGVQTIRMKSV